MNDKQPFPLTYAQLLENLYAVRNNMKRKKGNSPEINEMIQHTDDLIKILTVGRDDID